MATEVPTSTAAPAEQLLEELPPTLFIGYGATAIAWYRCVMPAIFLGADWVGFTREPPKLRYDTGLVKGQTRMPNFLDYQVMVVQQPRGRGWHKLIRGLQARGIRVLFEIDDYVHAIQKMKSHQFREGFSKEHLVDLEMNMRAADGIIASTPFIAEKYRRFNERVWVCENGVDTARYALTRPPRPTVNIGWAGGTGHENSAIPWLKEVHGIMERRDNTAFVSIGMGFADAFKPRFGPRAISIPFAMIETYPAAMTMFDIALAPAATRGRERQFFKGKSDLRWIEAGALGIPTIGDPLVYPKVEPGVTGFHASEPEEMIELLEQLVEDESLRLEVGENARRYVHEHRDMRVMARQWARVIQEVI